MGYSSKKVQFFESYPKKGFNSFSHVSKKDQFIRVIYFEKVKNILYVTLKNGFNFFESGWKEGFNSASHIFSKIVQFCESHSIKKFYFFESFEKQFLESYEKGSILRVIENSSIPRVIFKEQNLWAMFIKRDSIHWVKLERRGSIL